MPGGSFSSCTRRVRLSPPRRCSGLASSTRSRRGSGGSHPTSGCGCVSKGHCPWLNLQAWLDLPLSRLPGRSRLADVIRYALGRWSTLTRFLDDGRIDLDTNPVERAIRPIALGRKNSLFAGSEGGANRWAIIAFLVETAKLNGVELFAWLRDSLTMMVNGHPASRSGDLLPWSA